MSAKLIGLYGILAIIVTAAVALYSTAAATVLGIVLGLIFIFLLRGYTVVDLQEVHVLSGKGKVKEYTAGQSYLYFPYLEKRNIVPLRVLEIAIPRIKLMDMNNLPFGVEISCKVQISDPRTAVKALGQATPDEIRPIVDDTIQSAARAQAMKQTLITIMRERDEIEQAILAATNDSLARIGIRVVLFDIKNIVDVPGSTVIADMERVKSAELERLAREAEARENSAAEIVEAQKRAEAEIQRQNALKQSEMARLEQEMAVVEKQRELKLKEMDVINAQKKREAEIEAERIAIEANAQAEQQRMIAQGNADSKLIQAKADAESLKLKASAEADSIRLKLEAEAEGTKALADALAKFTQEGIHVKLAEIDAEAKAKVAESIARGIQHSSKLILPSNGVSNLFTNLVSGIETMKEAGISLEDIKGKKS